MPEESRIVQISREQPSATYTVSAKCCLWFTWSDLNSPPVCGDEIALHKPVKIDPQGALQVTVEVEGRDGLWAHHPGNTSGPEGNGDYRGLQRQEYKTESLKSDKIEELTTQLNTLVGFVGGDNPPAADRPDVTQEIVGYYHIFSLNEDNPYIYLGFHDGWQWNNNVDVRPMVVTITGSYA